MEADCLAGIAILAHLVGIISGLACYWKTSSLTTLGFILENAVCLIPASIIVWRFRRARPWANGALAHFMEMRAGFAISWCQVLLAVTSGGLSAAPLWIPDEEEQGETVILLSLPASGSAIALARLPPRAATSRRWRVHLHRPSSSSPRSHLLRGTQAFDAVTSLFAASLRASLQSRSPRWAQRVARLPDGSSRATIRRRD